MAGRLIVVEEVGSTQDLARDMAMAGEPDGTAVMALRQTRGRGRLGRTWISPPGRNVALSIILRPPMAPEEATLMGLLASMAVADALEERGVSGIGLRWPNDVLVGGKKIAGILSEATLVDRSVEFLILGIGLNVNGRESDFPSDLMTPATSLYLCTAVESNIEQVARDLIQRFGSLYERAKVEGCGFIPPAWERRWLHKNMWLHHEGTVGIGLGIDAQGALLLEKDGGHVERVTSGEVVPGPAA